jgi:DNA-binding NarL/FixJ family response regulator
MQMDTQSLDRYGTRQLSRRQVGVIELVARGLKNREIAEELAIGEQAVRNYLFNIFNKLGVSNRVELALWYEARKQPSGLVGKTA